MKIDDFEKELQTIDPNLGIRKNDSSGRAAKMFPEIDKIASVTYQGVDLFSVPNYNIYDEKNPSYGVDVRGDGRFVAHRTRLEALEGAKDKVEQLKNKDYSDAFFGRGDYSEAALRSNNEPQTELVEEVTADLEEHGGSEEIKHPLKEIE